VVNISLGLDFVQRETVVPFFKTAVSVAVSRRARTAL
jgi:hypothetical protein